MSVVFLLYERNLAFFFMPKKRLYINFYHYNALMTRGDQISGGKKYGRCTMYLSVCNPAD